MKKFIQLIFSQVNHVSKPVKVEEIVKHRRLAPTPESVPGRRFTRRSQVSTGPVDE